MTKQNEIKEYDKEFETLGIFIGIIIALLVILLILEFSIKQELSSVPHKVCENVTERINVSCNGFISIHIYEYAQPEFYDNVKAENITYKNVSKEEMDVMMKFLNNIEANNCYKEITKQECKWE